MAEILEKALDIALEKKDPKKKLERRQKRQEGKSDPKLESQQVRDSPTSCRSEPTPSGTSSLRIYFNFSNTWSVVRR